MPRLTPPDHATVRQALAGRSETDISRTIDDLSPAVCKADGKPLCESCWRVGKCVGVVTTCLDFTKRRPTWRSAEAALYGRID